MKLPTRFISLIRFRFESWETLGRFWISCIVLGLGISLMVIAGDWLIGQFHKLVGTYPWMALIITPLGLMLITWITQRFFPHTQGSGIPQIIAAINAPTTTISKKYLSIHNALAKLLLTLGGLACGASIGSAGPSVYIGACLLYAMGCANQPHLIRKGSIVAGGGAGIAAVFNAPLAGIVFAIEALGQSTFQFQAKTVQMILLAIVITVITTSILLGDHLYFGQFDRQISGIWPAVVVCGITGGLLGGGFSQTLIASRNKLAYFSLHHPYQLALFCGLIVGGIGLGHGPAVYGTGYEVARAFVQQGNNQFDLWFPLAKMLATLASYLSGIPGGIFSPSLAIGAGLGSDLGYWLPIAPIGVMIIFGMTGYFSGVVQYPITTFALVMELTYNQEVVLAVLVTSLIATLTSRLVCPKPIYQALALDDMTTDQNHKNQ